jgi:hypothetical protein
MGALNVPYAFSARPINHKATASSDTGTLRFHIAILKEISDEDTQVKTAIDMTCTRRTMIREAKAQLA